MSRLGAEALTLVGTLGPDLVPELWARKVGDDEKLRTHFADPGFPQYKRDAIEVQLAMNQVLEELAKLGRPAS